MKNIKISVIVPVYNEQNYLEKGHESLKNQKFKDYELIYIDDGSTDKSWEILKNFRKEPDVRAIKLERNYTLGYVCALGVTEAKGEYIARLDADCTPTPNWLDMVKYFDAEIGLIGFPVIPPPTLDYLRKFEYVGDGRPQKADILHHSGVIMKKDLVLKAGNYPDTRWGMDTVLFNKIIDMGYKVKYIEEAKIFHLPKQQNFKEFLKRFYNLGTNNKSVKTFLLFDFVFPLLIFISIVSVYIIDTLGLLSLILPIGFLANYKTILFYTRNFAKPKNKTLKFILFTIIKIIVSIAFVVGVWRATINKLFSHLHFSKT